MLLFVGLRNNCSVYVQIFQKAKVIVIELKIFENYNYNYNYTKPKSLNYNYVTKGNLLHLLTIAIAIDPTLVMILQMS